MKLKSLYISISLIAALSGAIFYIIHHEYIMIIFPQHIKTSEKTLNEFSQKKVILYLPSSQMSDFTQEESHIKISSNIRANHEQLVNAWLQTQTFSKKPIKLHYVTLSPDEKNIFINFKEESPFNLQSSTYDKIIWINALLKTLSAYNAKIEYVYFLVNNKPLEDYELDFSRPW